MELTEWMETGSLKICPNNFFLICPNNFFQFFLKSSPKFRATSVILIKLPKLNDRPLGENSPNLVTLIVKLLFKKNANF
jgi:hypothetical protein